VPLNYLGQNITLAVPNCYPFVTSNLQSGPWDWWGRPQLDLILQAVNGQLGTNFNADTLHNTGLLLNPDMSAAKARTYIDTVMAYFYPRACQALQLPGCAISSTEDVMIDEDRVQLQIAPNPASERIFISSKTQVAMEQIQLFDMNGLFLRSYNNIDHHQYEIQRGELPPGMYLLKVRFADGIAVKQVIIQ
jgi:hypothetical protein